MSVAAVAAPIMGAMIGQQQASADRTAAARAREQALAQYLGIDLPTLESQGISLENYISAGTLDPEMEQLVNLGPSAMENISVDPRLRAEQMAALEQMSGLASGNVTPGDVAGFELSRRNVAAENQAKQNQILQEMQARGQGGSGAELLARLTASQNSTDQLQNSQLQQAAKMQDARMQALQGQANMASNLRSQDYAEDANLAKAKDAIAQFNAQNSQNVNSRNTASKNNAQAANLQNTQNLANANVDTRNKQQLHNKGLIQNQFNNQMTLANAKAGQYGNQANAAQQNAANTAGMWANIGQGVGTAFASYNQQGNNSTPGQQKQQKTNVGGGSYYDFGNEA